MFSMLVAASSLYKIIAREAITTEHGFPATFSVD